MLTNKENRELAGYLGICWHERINSGNTERPKCLCGVVDDSAFRLNEDHIRRSNPNFGDPRVVLREMRKRGDWPEFKQHLDDILEDDEEAFDIILDTTGLLARAALDWFRKQKG